MTKFRAALSDPALHPLPRWGEVKHPTPIGLSLCSPGGPRALPHSRGVTPTRHQQPPPLGAHGPGRPPAHTSVTRAVEPGRGAGGGQLLGCTPHTSASPATCIPMSESSGTAAAALDKVVLPGPCWQQVGRENKNPIFTPAQGWEQRLQGRLRGVPGTPRAVPTGRACVTAAGRL